jgi:hypothetical protein
MEGYSRKSGSEKEQYPLQFRLTRKFSKSSMGKTPVLNEVKEQVLGKLTTDSSRKRFPRRKSGIELSIEEFLTVNQKKYPL